MTWGCCREKEIPTHPSSSRPIPLCAAYGVGRGPRSGSDFDEFIVDRVGKAFQDSGQLFPQLIEALVTSDVFRKREDEANTP